MSGLSPFVFVYVKERKKVIDWSIWGGREGEMLVDAGWGIN